MPSPSRDRPRADHPSEARGGRLSDRGFEILEHTADVGVRAWGRTLEEAFEQATQGLADILGAWRPGRGERAGIAVSAADIGGVLVDWLSEVLYLQESRDAVIAGVDIDEVTETRASGALTVAPRAEELDGVAVKAITYHQLSVEPSDAGWTAEYFVDV